MSSDIITFSSLSSFSQLVHGISTRKYGSIKQKGVVFTDNLENFLDAFSPPFCEVVFTRQVHGKDVLSVTNAPDKVLDNADGLITTSPGFFIGIATADCLPILFFDTKQQRIAVIHAGYKGILKGIIEETLTLYKEKGSDPTDILVGIGPGIGVCCYNVPQYRVVDFEQTYSFEEMYEKRDGEYFLDLKNIARAILNKHGVSASHIETVPFCTKCDNNLFFSFRGDTKETFGEFATIIGLRPSI